MPTLKQKATFKATIENLQQATPLNKKEILLSNGYSPTVANKPSLVYDSKAFQIWLSKIDERIIVDRWYEWATDGKDRRVAVQCGREILLLKDRYPASKSKVIGLFDTLDDLNPQDNESRTTE